MNTPLAPSAVIKLDRTCPDVDQIIAAICGLHCDALTSRDILDALSSRHKEWLEAQDLDVGGSVALALMADAQDALGDFDDWHRDACREQRRHAPSSFGREVWPLPGAPL